ncbi:DUF1963 domain-containing protein [Actibacterium sp. 188UL27-1]|uniref:DUF1963 domain-containing protein n=1 Tax=Actibacterium sp. 188UL27-1 TaxID=2786961 RepID=UPI00195D5129|nr:DUF1963 domain-containing protein [Actibacterium sp. 188UL27-1]MBM7066394.1 DUF1963 domain-containing protein [Actibacterium sp. 188UL27-1]
MFTDLAEARQILSDLFDPALLELVMAALVPAIAIQPTPDLTDSLTRIGGTPVMAAGIEWPRPRQPSDAASFQDYGEEIAAYAAANLPLSFVAQIDLADLTNLDGITTDLPTDGRLLFFYDMMVGPFEHGDRLAKVIWDQSDPTNAVTHPVPPALTEAAGHYVETVKTSFKKIGLPLTEGDLQPPFFAPPRLGELQVRQQLTPPNTLEFQQYSQLHDRAFKIDDLEFIERYTNAPWASAQDLPPVTLLGLPVPDQDDPRYDAVVLSEFGQQYLDRDQWAANKGQIFAQAKNWQLLLQVDFTAWNQSNSEGQIYFLIRQNDLKNRKFENVVAIYQQT